MKDSLNFQSLSPSEFVRKESYSTEAFDFAFGIKKNLFHYSKKKNDIYNIAVTAPYGAGKSSVVKSYLSERRKLKPLFVSLSKFASLSNNNFVDENEIERNILKQIFYHKKASFFSFSTLSRIRNVSLKKQLCGAIMVILVIIVLIIQYCNTLSSSLISVVPEDEQTYILPALIAIAIALLAAFLVDFFIRRRCSRIVLKDAELELDAGKESLISKSLDEIVYFFEVTKYDVIVFEDLDRLKENTIFLKLRELNKILKDYEGIHRQIKFVYVLNDDVLNGKDRTKFFDFIVPIVPIINYANAGNYLINLIKDEDIDSLKHLDKDFIYDLGMYIDDLRVLKNAVNEFLVYKEIAASSQTKHIADATTEIKEKIKTTIRATKKAQQEANKIKRAIQKASIKENQTKAKARVIAFLYKIRHLLTRPIQLRKVK